MKGDFSLELYLKEIRQFSLLSAEEENDVVTRYNKGNLQARDRLIRSNLRLVVNIAKRYANCGIVLADLIAEGNMGLIYAAERFRLSKGCRFSTYATFWIKHTICRAITEKNTLVRIPAYMKKILAECKKKSEVLLKELGHAPSIYEIIDHMKFSVTKGQVVSEGLFTNQALEGLQSLYTEQNQDFIEDIAGKEDMVKFWEQGEVEWLMQILEEMDSKRAQVIKLRYGLDGGSGMTLKEVAIAMKLTKERIRQIEKETISMLREYLKHSMTQGTEKRAPFLKIKRNNVVKVSSQAKRLVNNSLSVAL